MRRIRPNFKPNLGPRGGTRTTDSTVKTAASSTQGQGPSHSTVAPHIKGDTFTQLKPSEVKTPDAPSSSGDAPGAQPVAAGVENSSHAQSDKVGHGSRSPRKSPFPDHPKSPGLPSHKMSEASLSGGAPHPSPAKPWSPRKSASTEMSQNSGKAASEEVHAADSEVEKESPAKKGVSTAENSGKAKKGVALSNRTVTVRGPRPKFKPNLGAVGRTRALHKPGTAEKETPEAESHSHDQSEENQGQGQTVVESAEVTSSAVTETTAAADSQVSADSQAREKTLTEPQQPNTHTAEQPVTSGQSPSVDEVDRGKEGSVRGGGDDDSASVSSGATEELGGSPGENDGFTMPHTAPKLASEKKMRRLKPVLPSTEATVDRGKMKMSDLIYWNPSRNPMKKKENQNVQSPASNSPVGESCVDGEAPSPDGGGQGEEASEEDMMVPQVKVDASGKIVLNMDSLLMENKAAQPSNLSLETIEEDEDRFITCNSFRNNSRQKRWTQNETARFYKALSQVGTDFSLMCRLFPSRSRRELKNKFTKEGKRNGPRIDQALRERQAFDRTTFEKALEEDAAEKRRQEALEAEKKRKKERKMKMEREAEDDEDVEMDEEEIEKKIYQEEQEERKENSRKRSNGKLCQDGGKFPAYKRMKTSQNSSGHAREVVEILVNMNQGQGAKPPGNPTPFEDISDTASVASDHESLTSASPFVPRVARQPTPGLHSASRNVVFDSEVSVPDWTVQDGGEIGGDGDARAVGVVETVCAEDRGSLPGREADSSPSKHSVTTTTTTAASSVPGFPNTAPQPGNTSVPVSVTPSSVTQPNSATPASNTNPVTSVDTAALVNTPAVPGMTHATTLAPGVGQWDLAAVLESLQLQTSQPVDVVLVEQQLEGQEQGMVHVYLVPRAAGSEGGVENSVLTEGDAGSSGEVEGSVGSRVVDEGGVQKSLLAEEGVVDSMMTQSGVQNTVMVEGGDGNSGMTEGGVGNSMGAGDVTTSVLTEGAAQNSAKLEGGVQNSVSMDGRGDSILTEGGGEHSMTTEKGSDLSVSNLTRSLLTQSEGGEKNSCMTGLDAVTTTSVLTSSSCGVPLNKGGEENSRVTECRTGSGGEVEGGRKNSALTEGDVNSVLREEGASR